MPVALLKHKYESNAGERAAHSQAALISLLQSISTDGGLSPPQSSEVYTERHVAQGLLHGCHPLSAMTTFLPKFWQPAPLSHNLLHPHELYKSPRSFHFNIFKQTMYTITLCNLANLRLSACNLNLGIPSVFYNIHDSLNHNILHHVCIQEVLMLYIQQSHMAWYIKIPYYNRYYRSLSHNQDKWLLY